MGDAVQSARSKKSSNLDWLNAKKGVKRGKKADGKK